MTYMGKNVAIETGLSQFGRSQSDLFDHAGRPNKRFLRVRRISLRNPVFERPPEPIAGSVALRFRDEQNAILQTGIPPTSL
jgi:hypothetical protein